MADGKTDNGDGRVTLAVLGTKLDYLIDRVDDLKDDHETRIRRLEKQGNWRWLAEAAIAVAAAVGIGTGVKR